MTRNWEIPLCRSEFLQDFSIELGRRFPAHQWSFQVQTDTCEQEGRVLEELTLLACTPYETGARLIVREDGRVWVDIVLWPTRNNGEYRVGFYCPCEGFTHERIIEAFRDTINVSTRLCYGESPLSILRQIWNYTGEVKTHGELVRSRKAQPGASPNGGLGAQVDTSGAVEGPPSVS
jgi:hypothetical protein